MKKLFILFFVFSSVKGFADVRNFGDIDLIPINEHLLPDRGQKLIGGEPAKPEDWPATVYASMGGSRCTATLLGPKFLLIAAHCVGNGRNATFRAGGESYSSVCTHNPLYRGDSTADYAYCLVDREVKNVVFENLNIVPDFVKMSDKITLTGYGCVRPGGGGGNDGVYRVGTSTVIKLPSGGNNDIVTKGGAALCYGDSGGPAFKYSPDGKTRWQISVNSRGDIRTTSYLPSVATDEYKVHFKAWKDSKGVKVCGIDQDVGPCQGVPPGPPVPPLPEDCASDLNLFTKCLFGSPRLALSEPEACREAHANLLACEELAEKAE